MINKISALLGGLVTRRSGRGKTSPAAALRGLCHHWWQLAERRNEVTKTGILSDLKRGNRSK